MRQRAAVGTLVDGWSEIVPSQEAAGVGEGWGAGAGGMAVWRLGDVAVALVVAVIHRAGHVLTEGRVLQSCRGSGEAGSIRLGSRGETQPTESGS